MERENNLPMVTQPEPCVGWCHSPELIPLRRPRVSFWPAPPLTPAPCPLPGLARWSPELSRPCLLAPPPPPLPGHVLSSPARMRVGRWRSSTRRKGRRRQKRPSTGPGSWGLRGPTHSPLLTLCNSVPLVASIKFVLVQSGCPLSVHSFIHVPA